MRQKKATIVDTNVILRFLLADIPHLYERATEIFQQMEEGKRRLLLTDLVLSECVWVLEKYYTIPKKEVAEKLTAFTLGDQLLTQTPKTIISTALHLWSTSSLDWTDAFLVAKVTTEEGELITFDQEIVKKFPEICAEGM
jgi:predicted nucleic acid-binding protein